MSNGFQSLPKGKILQDATEVPGVTANLAEVCSELLLTPINNS